MTEQHFDIESIFDCAVEIDSAAERLADMAAACGGDDQLRCRVEALFTSRS